MRLTGVSPESGGTGLSVQTTLPNPSTRPGLRLPGRVTLAAGPEDVLVRHIRLGLVTTVEPDDPAAARRLMQFHQLPIAGRFVVPAGRRRAVDFAFPLPWETPVTTFGGVPLLSLRMGLRTEVSLDPDLDQGAMVPVFVHPTPHPAARAGGAGHARFHDPPVRVACRAGCRGWSTPCRCTNVGATGWGRSTPARSPSWR